MPLLRRLPLILWCSWLSLLAATWLSAWLWPGWHHHLAECLQSLYGTPFATSPWYLRGNAPLHAFVAMQASLCLVMGLHLLRPAWSAWWGFAITVLICLVDELAQGISTIRGFDVRDWESDAAGLVLAAILLGLWQVFRGRPTRAGSKSAS